MAGIVADAGIPLLYADGEYSAKVTTVNDQTFDESVMALLYTLISTNKDILEQMRLLNLRFEEAFDTHTDEKDIA